MMKTLTKAIFLLTALVGIVSCGKENPSKRTYSQQEQALVDAGINIDDMKFFFRENDFQNCCIDQDDYNIYAFPAFDNDHGYIFLLNYTIDPYSSERTYKYESTITLSRPEKWYTYEDVGYGEKLYKVYDGPELTSLRYYNGKRYAVIGDFFHYTSTEPKVSYTEIG